ncbi:conjugal transfer protein TraC [Phyllobacterium phragmitis]|uniref:Conjugal transfer protein TraC n=1 Tax=Phyllobacterium phragmitis TaxID=2670329 RepID=A0A2S9IRD4_9HYPH|nr:DUF5710 domain-containing protein [Phyllobacterium phragmitis]PRD43072.1 conjugal transfer protein TraC [Phyllobacterium phragmitis]
MRIDLNVPYPQKDEVKKLGARWNPSKRVWYVPDGVDPAPFARWLPAESDFNLRAAEAYLVRSPARCWRCSEPFAAVGLLMAPGFEMRDYDEDEHGEEVRFWFRHDEWAFAHYITDLPPAVVKTLKSEAPLYRPAFSKTTQTTYWANHCPACKVLQGDFNLFEEPDGAFFPMSVNHVRRMKATRLAMPFEAVGSPSFGIDEADLLPGVRSPRTERRRDVASERLRQTIFVKPPVGQSTPLPPRRQGGLMGRLKSLIGGKR